MPMQERNHRNTRQKTAILDYLQTSGGAHITADALLERLRELSIPVGRATVYRYLKQLEEAGAIQKYVLPDLSGSCYVYVGEGSGCRSHCHVKCQQCGEILHVDSELPARFTAQMEEQFGFTVDEGKTVFYGLCKQCGKDTTHE